MIVKMGESLLWEEYQKTTTVVRAIRLQEDFYYETRRGWVQGYKGQWLVELGEGLRVSLDHEAFERSYKPMKDGGEG